MQRNLKRLADEMYDLLILGGGINGLAAAWDAALRGLKVALVEKSDFGAETSSATLKIIHGGLRYLQHLDFIRSRESIRERSALLRIAPHLVHPFSFLVPTFGHLMKGKEFMTAGLIMNELVSYDRNRNLKDPLKHIPAGRVVSRRECLERMPGLNDKGLTGGVIFYDAQMYNSERLTLSFALSAAARGADLANYVEAVALLRQGARVTGARVRDGISGAEFDIRAAVVANMTGPWSDIILGLLDKPKPDRNVLRSKGIQIVAPSLTGDMGLGVASRHRDPDALFSRGARHYFITPWRGVSLIGTTDTIYRGDPDDFRITGKDIGDFIDELNEAMPSARLSRAQVPFAFGGLRPITETNLETGSQVSRKYEITDHAETLGIEGLVTVIGVKYTTGRLLAEKVINCVFKKLNRPSPRVVTAETPLAGGDIERLDSFMQEANKNPLAGLDEQGIRHLVYNYGSGLSALAARVQKDPRLGERLPGSKEVIKAEILQAVREECALHLPDVVFRRTDLGTLGHPGRPALQACADLMAAELGWDEARKGREFDAVEKRYDFRD